MADAFDEFIRQKAQANNASSQNVAPSAAQTALKSEADSQTPASIGQHNPQLVQQQAAQAQQSRLIDSNPVVALWAANKPVEATATRDDWSALGKLGDAVSVMQHLGLMPSMMFEAGPKPVPTGRPPEKNNVDFGSALVQGMKGTLRDARNSFAAIAGGPVLGNIASNVVSPLERQLAGDKGLPDNTSGKIGYFLGGVLPAALMPGSSAEFMLESEAPLLARTFAGAFPDFAFSAPNMATAKTMFATALAKRGLNVAMPFAGMAAGSAVGGAVAGKPGEEFGADLGGLLGGAWQMLKLYPRLPPIHENIISSENLGPKGIGGAVGPAPEFDAEMEPHHFDEPPQPGTNPIMDEVWAAHAEATEQALKDVEAAFAETKTSKDPALSRAFLEHTKGEVTLDVDDPAVKEILLNDPTFGEAIEATPELYQSFEQAMLGDGKWTVPMSHWLTTFQPWNNALRKAASVGDGITPNQAKELGDNADHTVQPTNEPYQFNPIQPQSLDEDGWKALGLSLWDQLQLGDHLPADVKSALSLYTTTPGYQSVNDFLRKGSLAKAQEHHVNVEYLHGKMQEAFQHANLPSDAVLYRGVQGTGHTAPKWEELHVGQVIHDKGYMSTSLDSSTGDTFAKGGYSNPGSKNGYVLRIKAKKGAKALPLHGVATLEKEKSEILLNAGSKLKVTAIDHEKRIVDAELLSEEEAGKPANMSDEEVLKLLEEPKAEPEYDEDMAAAMGLSHGDFMHATGKDFPEPEDIDGVPWDQIDEEDKQEIAQAKQNVIAATNKVIKDRFLKQLFSTASALNMSPEQFRLYSEKAEALFAGLKDKLWKQQLEKVKKKYTKAWKESYDHHFPLVSAEWMAKPVIKASYGLRYSTKTQSPDAVDLVKGNDFVKDGKPITFYHASDKSTTGTPANPWKLQKFKVFSFSTSPHFINKWADSFSGGDSFNPYYVPHNYDQSKAPTHYVTHLTAKKAGDFRKPDHVAKARKWYETHPKSEWPQYAQSYDIEEVRAGLPWGNWVLWEHPPMWHANGWDAAYMMESPYNPVKPHVNAAVAKAEQIHFKYVERALEQEHKLHNDVKKLYPANLWEKLPNSMFSADGMMPDDLAEIFGHTSGERMLKELTRFENERGKTPFNTYLAQQIKAETRARTIADVGDLLDPNKILEDARAIFSDPQLTDLLIDPYKKLAEEHGLALSKEQIIQEAVEGFKTLTMRRALKAVRATERTLSMSSRKVESLLMKGKVLEALQLKQRQMQYHIQLIQAHELAREYVRFQAEARSWSASTMSGMDQEFLNRIHEVLRDIGLPVKRDPEELQEALGPHSLEDWAQDYHTKTGGEIITAPYLRGLDIKSMPVGMFQGIHEMLKSIAHAGREARKITVAGKKQELDDLAAEMAEHVDVMRKRLDYDKTRTDSFPDALRNMPGHVERDFWAYMLAPETIVEALDDDKIAGPLGMALNRPIQEGAIKKKKLLEAVQERLQKFLKMQPDGWEKALRQKIDTGNLAMFNGKPLFKTRAQLLMAALNAGNDGNWTKFLKGWGIPEEEMQTLFDKYLTKADWDFVQHMWNEHDLLKDEISAVYRRITGLRPTWVTRRTISTPFGPIEGNYWPIDYDWNAATFLGIPIPRSIEEAGNPFGREVTSALPPNPHTKGRTNYYAPISVAFDTVFGKLGAVIHDVAYREALMQATKILNHAGVRKQIAEGLGPEFLEALENWKDYVAHQSLHDSYSRNVLSTLLRMERNALTVLGLGWRVSTAALHGPTAFFNSMGEVGKLAFGKALRDLYTGVNWGAPESTKLHKWISEQSTEIRTRRDNVDRELNAAAKRIVLKRGFMTWYEKTFFWLVAQSDMFSAKAVWLSGYRMERKANPDISHEEAVLRADRYVRRAHGSGAPEQLAAVQRGGLGPMGEVGRMMTLFTSFLNHILNRTWTGARRLKVAGRKWNDGDKVGARRDMSRGLALLFWTAGMALLVKELEDEYRGNSSGGMDWGLNALHTVFGSFPVVADGVEMLKEAKREGFTANAFLHAGSHLPLVRPFGLAAASVAQTPAVLRKFGAMMAGDEDADDIKVPPRWLETYLNTATAFGAKLPGGAGTELQMMYNSLTGVDERDTFNDWVQGVAFGPQTKAQKKRKEAEENGTAEDENITY